MQIAATCKFFILPIVVRIKRFYIQLTG